MHRVTITADHLRALDAHLEIHCNSAPISAGLARRIKATGGSYSECRGHKSRRFVNIPVTTEGLELADHIIRTIGAPAGSMAAGTRSDGSTVVVIFKHRRTENYMARATVHYVPRRGDDSRSILALTMTAAAINEIREAGICTASVADEEVDADKAEADALARRQRLERAKLAGAVLDALRNAEAGAAIGALAAAGDDVLRRMLASLTQARAA